MGCESQTRSSPVAFSSTTRPSPACGDWCRRHLRDNVCAVPHVIPVPESRPPVVLTAVADPDVSANVERVIAAVGLRMSRVEVPTRRGWLAAAAVVLDESSARLCVQAGLPRRDGVLVVGQGEGGGTPATPVWAAAVDVGAGQVCVLPEEEDDVMRHLSEALESGLGGAPPGRVIGVTPGRGGAGASVFAAALAHCAGESLLVDADPCGGGIDLLLGSEGVVGLRWPDLQFHRGRLTWSAMREVLPRKDGVSFLSATRSFHDIDPEALAAVLDAGRRGGLTVLCDIPRQLTPVSLRALQLSDLVVVVTSCDVRGAAAAAAMVSVLTTVNSTIGLVVRGPSPGGLRAREVAAATGAPLLAAMRPDAAVTRRLEHGGLRVGRRSPLAVAARTVLDVVARRAA